MSGQTWMGFVTLVLGKKHFSMCVYLLFYFSGVFFVFDPRGLVGDEEVTLALTSSILLSSTMDFKNLLFYKFE